MATSDEHKPLTLMGASWLKKMGFGVVGTEMFCHESRERPDVVGFRTSCSAVIEVKVSRSDFFADRSKPVRLTGGIGIYRFYLCPEGLIKPEEIPPRWGLLYAKGRSVVALNMPMGNRWPGLIVNPIEEPSIVEWRALQRTPNPVAERSCLYSLARREVSTS